MTTSFTEIRTFTFFESRVQQTQNKQHRKDKHQNQHQNQNHEYGYDAELNIVDEHDQHINANIPEHTYAFSLPLPASSTLSSSNLTYSNRDVITNASMQTGSVHRLFDVPQYDTQSLSTSFILWRLLEDNQVLELRHYHSDSSSYSDSELSRSSSFSPVFHFLLPSPALSPPRIAQDSDSLALHVIIITQECTFYRLLFPYPNYFEHLESLSTSSNSQPIPVPDQFVQFYQVSSLSQLHNPFNETNVIHNRLHATAHKPNKFPVTAHFPDLDTICIACSDGTIVQVDCPRTESDYGACMY